MFLSDKCVVDGRVGTVNAYAKVNLTLDVTGKRADGYHDILSVMRIVDIYDIITVQLTDNSGIQLTTNLDWLPTDRGNIAYKAAEAVLEASGAEFGVKIHIHKNIPCGAGMGGGSADGAGVIALINRLLKNILPDGQLLEIAARIGADVPFCLKGGTCVASGIGEKLTRVNSKGEVPILVVKPEISISTAKMYNVIDSTPIENRPDTEGMKKALETGDIRLMASKLCNVMEPPAIDEYSVIGEIKNKMLSLGAFGAMMTGSGSAVFGIFESSDKADCAKEAFVQDYDDVFSTVML